MKEKTIADRKELEDLKSLLPYGGISEISKKANLPYSNVQRFFVSRRSPSNEEQEIILRAYTEVLQEMEQSRKKAYKQVANVLLELAN
ncbi:hypothetical protein [Flammeovirga sp. EKP202]|uniref:hypothetical protein n=1 Tax=Flammeovirga sp. EKP202 TaxID=2770592 RepID=UPI00165F31B7|nr:hypothetical protein [Flammeovirga sp. EKP202]MBD0402923.1 hypothetical protein [Flammeovirga sp. EKP202]